MKKIKVFLIAAFVSSSSLYAQTIQDGLKALDNDQFAKAKSIFQSMLTGKPEVSAEAYYHLAGCYFKTEKKDSAEIVVNKMMTAFPANPLSKVALGRLALANKNQNAAKAAFDEALKISINKDAKVMQYIAEAYLTAEDPDGPAALQALTPATKIDAKNPELCILTGDAYKLDQSAGGQAVTNYEKVLDMNVLQAKANQRIGVIYTQARNFQSSSDAFEKSLAADANYAPAYRDYAMLNYNFKRFQKARELYEKYLSMADTTELSLTRYVYILFLVKDYQKATDEINELKKMDASNNLLNRLLAYSYSEQKKDSIGLIYMNLFLSRADSSKIIPLDYKYYGHMLSQTGQDSLGILYLRKALAFDSTDVDVLQDLGVALNRVKDYCGAAAVLQSKVNNSKTPSALDYYLLSKAYYFCKDYVNADSAAIKIIEKKPDNYLGYFWRGRANSKLHPDTIDIAFPFYMQVTQISEDTSKKAPDTKDLLEAYDVLSTTYIQKDDKANARKALNRIIALDPDDKYGYLKRAKDYLERLK
ncbi:MAG: tetratricopeptide repeat protein [Bacteroidia bacterium]